MNSWHELTERQKRIALLAAEGKKDTFIAHEVGISETRVSQILRIIFNRFDVVNRTAFAFELGKHWKEIHE